MKIITNVSKNSVGIDVEGEHKTLAPGDSIPVEGDFSDHLFVQSGWLTISDQEVAEHEELEEAEEVEEEEAETEEETEQEGPYSIRHKSKGRFEVIGADDSVVSEKLLSKEDAQKLADELNANHVADSN